MKVTGYNRQKYLMESLIDLDNQLRDVGSQLFVCEGSPVDIFTTLHKEIGLTHLSFEQVNFGMQHLSRNGGGRRCLVVLGVAFFLLFFTCLLISYCNYA